MIRKIIVPTERQYVLQIPESFIGKNVEVLAFEVSEADSEESSQDEGSFSERTKNLRYHSGGYKFNREEANDYE
jgi:hypothetical protein